MAIIVSLVDKLPTVFLIRSGIGDVSGKNVKNLEIKASGVDTKACTI